MNSVTEVWLPVLGTVLACVAGGAGWLVLFKHKPQHRAEALGLSFLCGAAWLAVVVTLLGFVGAVATLPVLLAACALPLSAAVVLQRRFLPDSGPSLGGGAMGFCVALTLVSLWLASARPVWNVDAQTRWVLHGQWIAETGTAVPEFLAEEEWVPTHPTYPPLVPALIALDLQLGADRDFGVRPLFPFFLLAMLAVLHGAGRRIADKRADWIVIAFALTPILLYIDRSQSGGGTGADAALADLPLAAYITALGACFLSRAQVGDRATWCLALALGCGAALTKQEGVPMVGLAWLVTGLLLVRGSNHPRAARAWLFSGLGVLAATGAWRLLVRNMPIESGENYLSLDSLGALGDGLGRLADVASRVGTDLLTLEVWGPLWWAVPVAIVLLLIGRTRMQAEDRWRPALALLALLLANTLLVIAAYLVSGWRGGHYERLMNVTLSRLLLHHAGLVPLFWMVLAPSKRDFALSETGPNTAHETASAEGAEAPTENL